VYVCAVVFYLLSVARERFYRAVAGMCGMFDTRLSVCLCSVVLFGVRSEAELLRPGKVFADSFPREIFCVFVP
jgi:hypothetical protein